MAIAAQDGALPPGLMMAAQVPAKFETFCSTSRPPGAPHFDRLLLLSSRLNQPMKVSLSLVC